MIVLSPKVGEESATALAEALGWKYENPYETGNRDYRNYDKVFKYGFSKPIKAKKGAVLNKTEHVNISRNKIKTLEALEDSGYTIQYTTDRAVAEKWLISKIVVARASVDGADGDGLTYCSTKKELDKTQAMFWTKYVSHTHEFRVNVWKGKVLSVYEKKVNGGFFKFCLFKGQEEHPQLVDLVSKVYNKIPLDFCGIDILRDKKGNLHLLEVNSAPILFPYTLNKLVKAINKELNP